MRRLLLALPLLLAACASSAPRAPAQPQVQAPEQALVIQSSVLPLKFDEPAVTTVGRLLWRGGVVLTANSADFGGWSDLHVSRDGRTLKAISDEGSWLTAEIRYDSRGNLLGLGDGRIGRLNGLDGKPMASKSDTDAESLARLADGSWLVGFERRHRIWRYPAGEEAHGRGLAGTPVPVEGPAQLARQPANGGLEAIAALPDGRVIMLSEEYSELAGTTMGWIGQPSGDGFRWQSFHYAAIPDFRPTAIAVLPGGGLVTLERAFDVVRGVRVRVMRFDASQIVPGNIVRAEELARLAVPYAVDNLEGIAATRGSRGETLVWLLSDDNFNRAQRTILLLFELQ
jgi:hypothetical protein